MFPGMSRAATGIYRGRARANAETSARADAKVEKRAGTAVGLGVTGTTSHRALISVGSHSLLASTLR